ncbi:MULTISPECIES: hypothetical protein [Streptomyces]|uniref:TNase-like domain-containing protein n=1 Tax=Streptomyces doebereineriae TaxID=3075528 RepID=A0ABU2VPI6_9ACTN|nr:hypothetical protein [Streptomyces sp. DSM 41640]MDT0487522.1 hypothetical protein [Streptomyces sp. DSM 41640]
MAAGAAVLLGGLTAGILLIPADDEGDGTGSGGSVSLSAEGVVACSTSIAEGRVAKVEQLAGGKRFRVLLTVERTYKPTDEARQRLTFTTEEPDAEAYYRAGVRMLVLVPSHENEAPSTYREGDPPPNASAESKDRLQWGRAWVQKALPAAKGIECSGKG